METNPPQLDNPDINLKIDGTLALITLNRPHVLNALSQEMRARLSAWLGPLSRDPQVYAVILESTSPRAFSVGADVKEISALSKTDREAARKAFRDEYTLNWQIECFTKPIVSLINGPVMGGGVGISLYGTHRIAGEKFSFAMPETRIGFFPDVGVAKVLAHMPGFIGRYLGLTGRSLTRADAYALGLVTHCIPAVRFNKIKDGLVETMPLDPLLDEMHEDPGPGELQDYLEAINRCFSGSDIETILSCLEKERGRFHDWAMDILRELKERSPTSLVVTYHHINNAKNYDLREVLLKDYELASSFLEDHDFYEGIRAYLIDRDGQPRWSPSNLDDEVLKKVETYFSKKRGDFSLPTREELQKTIG